MRLKFRDCGIILFLCLSVAFVGSLARIEPAAAQAPRPSGPNYWRHYNTSNSNILSNNVQAIAYTEDRNVDIDIPGLWIGTDAGMSYTNGRDWTSYTTTNSRLPGQDIRAIIKGHQQSELWIATDAGVARLNYAGTPRDREDDTWDVFATANGLPSDDVLNLALGPGDQLWVGTTRGPTRYDGVTWRAYTHGLPNLNIRDLVYDVRRNALWAATGEGVGRLDLGTETWILFRASSSGSGLPNDDARALALSDDGRVWMGTAGGLAALAPDGTWKTWGGGKPGLPFYPVAALSLDPSGRYLWVATDGGGASRYDMVDTWAHFDNLNSDLPDDHVRAVLSTHEGTAWLGTAAGLSGMERLGETYSLLVPRVSDQLASNSVQAIWVGPTTGTVWVGTGNGVSRSDDDGQTWQTFTTKHGLGSNYVQMIWGDTQGTMWAGTNDGVSRSDDGGQTWQTFTKALGLGSNNVRAVWGDVQGTIWVGTDGGGVSRSGDGGRTWQTFTTKHGLGSNDVRAVWGDAQGTVWVGTTGGVSRSDDGGQTWRTFTKDHGLGSGYVLAVWCDVQGTVWVGTLGGGGVSSNDGGQSWQTLKVSHFVQAIWGDTQGTVWVGTDSGVSRTDDGGQTWQTFTKAQGLGSSNVRAVWGDVQGTIWVGTDGGGVSRSGDGGKTWRTFNAAFEYGLKDNDVWAVWGDAQGTLWVGTDIGGVSRSDDGGRTWQTFTMAHGLESNHVQAVWGDAQGTVWASAGGALNRSTDGGRSWQTLVRGLVQTVWGDAQGTVWVGTDGGGVSRSGDGGRTWQTFTTKHGLGSNDVRAVWGDTQGRMWVGTGGGGVSRSDDDGQTWQTFTITHGLGSNYIQAVWGDAQGTVWAGTYRDGVNRSGDGGQTWQVFTMTHGLGSDYAQSVWCDAQGTVWVGTMGAGGVSRSDDGGQSWQTFLKGSVIRAVWGDDRGTVWVGTAYDGVKASDDGGQTWRTFTKGQGWGSDWVQAVWGDPQGTVWVGTSDGVSRSADSGKSWQTFTPALGYGLGSGQVQAVWSDTQGTVWAGTSGGGVSRSTDGGQTWQTFTRAQGLGSNNIQAVWGDALGTIWVGTDGGGVSRSDDGGQNWQTFTTARGLGSDSVQAVWGDAQGTVWAGTSKGVSRSDDGGQNWQTFLGSSSIQAMWGDARGTVWVGRYGGGVSRSNDSGQSWQTFTTARGLGSDSVQAVWGDAQGKVWVGTSKGVSRSDDGGQTWQTFTITRGLGSNNIQAVWGDDQGMVWVGTYVGGVSRLVPTPGPASLAQWLAPAQLTISSTIRLLDVRTLDAQFAGLSLAPASDLDVLRYAIVLSPTARGRQVLSQTFTAGEIGQAGIAAISLGSESSPLALGDYELSLTTTDRLLGRSVTTRRTVEVQARPSFTRVTLYQGGVMRLDLATGAAAARPLVVTNTAGLFTATLTFIDPDSPPEGIIAEYSWDPGAEPAWHRLGEDGIATSGLISGSHILAFRAIDPDGNGSREPLKIPIQMATSPSSSNLTWLLGGATVVLVIISVTGLSLRRYLAYAEQWAAVRDHPLQQIIPLIAPRRHINIEELLQRLRDRHAFSTEDQVQQSLDALVERGMMHLEGNVYRLASRCGAWVHARIQARHISTLAERVRAQHPFYVEACHFLEQAGFTPRSIALDPFGFRCTSSLALWAADSPLYVRLVPERALDRQEFEALYEAAKAVYGGKLRDRKAVIVIDRPPKPGDLHQIFALRAQEGFTVVPLPRSLMVQSRLDENETQKLQEQVSLYAGRTDLYDVRTAVSDVLSFFGRSGLLADLERQLMSGQSAVVFGVRKMGKSSLLNRLREECPWPVALVDLEGYTGGLGYVYDEALPNWRSALRTSFADLSLPDWSGNLAALKPAAQARAFRQVIANLLDLLADQPGRPGLLLFLDEIDMLFDQPEYLAFAATLRSVAQDPRCRGRFAILATGLEPALSRVDRTDNKRNPFYNFFSEMSLGPLDLQDAHTMVVSIGDQMGISYDNEARDLLVGNGGGHPFLTRQLCSQAIRDLERPGTVDAHRATRAIEDYLRQPHNYLAESLWGVDSKGPPLEDAALLRSLAAIQPQPEENLIPTGLSPEEQRAYQLALDHLHDQSLIRRVEGGWELTIPLYRRWIRRYVLNLSDEPITESDQ